jgi:hypothetical protein
MPISPQAGDSVTRSMMLYPQPHGPAGMVRGANQGHPCVQGAGKRLALIIGIASGPPVRAGSRLSPSHRRLVFVSQTPVGTHALVFSLCVIPSVPLGLRPT